MAFPIAAAVALAAEFAPMLTRWLGGDKAGDIAEDIAGVAKSITGDDSLEGITKRLREDAQARIAFQQRMAELDFAYYQADQSDRADARARDVAIRQHGGTNPRADVLAVLVVLGLIGMAGALLFFEPPAGAGRDLLLLLAGALVNAFAAIIAYEFGSSRGSRAKDAALLLK